ncbi:DUF5682 family protein, partial [Kineococcus glutinatus]|uniref:DUF5682 family protein n=1 Tax=Kineococcus glutinatus TaxID=1070872 RepID=UPI0031F1423C
MTPSGAAAAAPQDADEVRVEVCGVRHHGPGSARAVLAALEALQPDVVLVEGPADADHLVPLVAAAGMEPPVALLAHVVGEPARAAWWPLAAFSPEWQALRWAARRGVPVRFCDLPSTVVLAGDPDDPADPAGEPAPDDPAEPADPAGEPDALRADPVAALAAARGYDDPERWWDDVVE